jgi:hypothetical protein
MPRIINPHGNVFILTPRISAETLEPGCRSVTDACLLRAISLSIGWLPFDEAKTTRQAVDSVNGFLDGVFGGLRLPINTRRSSNEPTTASAPLLKGNSGLFIFSSSIDYESRVGIGFLYPQITQMGL